MAAAPLVPRLTAPQIDEGDSGNGAPSSSSSSRSSGRQEAALERSACERAVLTAGRRVRREGTGAQHPLNRRLRGREWHCAWSHWWSLSNHGDCRHGDKEGSSLITSSTRVCYLRIRALRKSQESSSQVSVGSELSSKKAGRKPLRIASWFSTQAGGEADIFRTSRSSFAFI